jgi:hypothetical protein
MKRKKQEPIRPFMIRMIKEYKKDGADGATVGMLIYELLELEYGPDAARDVKKEMNTAIVMAWSM